MVRGFIAANLAKQNDAEEIYAAADPGTSYVAATVVNCARYGSVALLVDITKGDETTHDFKFEFSSDEGTTYFQEGTTAAPSAGVSDTRPHSKTVTSANLAAGSNKMVLALLDTNAFNRLKVWVKRSGGTGTGTVAISAAGGAN